MEFETVFEISRHPFPTTVAMCFMFFLVAVLFLKQQYKEYKEKNAMTPGHKMILLLCTLLCIGTGVIFLGVVLDKPDQQFADQYYTGDYEVVEGEVENYSSIKMGQCEFDVDGENFYLQLFFRKPVPEEGYVRISFIKDIDINEIMKIEVAKE